MAAKYPGRVVELNAALARSYEAHRLLSGVDFSRDTADEAVEPCGQNPRFQLHRDSGTPVSWPPAACGTPASRVPARSTRARALAGMTA